MLNLKHLYYYYVFAQDLSTSKAARRLGITAPALSNQLKQLDECSGMPLTRRADGKVLITSHGEMILHYAERMFSIFEELTLKLASSRDLTGTCFRVGIGRNIGARFSLDLLSLLERSNIFLSKRVQITFDSSSLLLEGFIKNQFDFILGTFDPELTEAGGFISQRRFFPVRLFAPLALLEGVDPEATRHILSDPGKLVEFANSRKISLVLPMHPCVLRDETERFFSSSKVCPLKTFECNSSGGIVQLIESGLAMGFVPSPSLLDFKSARQLAILGPPEGYWSHGISVLTQKEKGKEEGLVKSSRLAEILSPASARELKVFPPLN